MIPFGYCEPRHELPPGVEGTRTHIDLVQLAVLVCDNVDDIPSPGTDSTYEPRMKLIRRALEHPEVKNAIWLSSLGPYPSNTSRLGPPEDIIRTMLTHWLYMRYSSESIPSLAETIDFVFTFGWLFSARFWSIRSAQKMSAD